MWLAQTVLAQPRKVVLWATRKESRPWLKWLLAEGHAVVAVVDVDPKKIGATRRGVPVVPPEALAEVEAEIALVGVGGVGARVLCRAMLEQVRPEWREGSDWWAIL